MFSNPAAALRTDINRKEHEGADSSTFLPQMPFPYSQAFLLAFPSLSFLLHPATWPRGMGAKKPSAWLHEPNKHKGPQLVLDFKTVFSCNHLSCTHRNRICTSFPGNMSQSNLESTGLIRDRKNLRTLCTSGSFQRLIGEDSQPLYRPQQQNN